MNASRHCPVCGELALGFKAQATPNDPELIEVVAQCGRCKYMFLHHFGFEEMHSSEFAQTSGVDEPARSNPLSRIK